MSPKDPKKEKKRKWQTRFDVGRGALQLSALAVLRRCGRLNGYRIAKELRRADPAFEIPYGVVYPLLEYMEADKLVRGQWETGQGRSGQYVYEITPRGRKALEKSEATWSRVVRNIRLLLRASG